MVGFHPSLEHPDSAGYTQLVTNFLCCPVDYAASHILGAGKGAWCEPRDAQRGPKKMREALPIAFAR